MSICKHVAEKNMELQLGTGSMLVGRREWGGYINEGPCPLQGKIEICKNCKSLFLDESVKNESACARCGDDSDITICWCTGDKDGGEK